jgi:hypothetical protein
MSNDDSLTRSQKKARNELLDRARKALVNEDTRYLLRWLMDQTGMFDLSYRVDGGTEYNEGRRSIGLELVALLNQIDPYEFVRLMKDGADEIVRLRSNARSEQDDD